MLRLHFLFGDNVWYDGSDEDTEAIGSLVREHLGLIEKERYDIILLRDETDPVVRYVLVEDRVVLERTFDVACFSCFVSQERPRCTVWIDPPNPTEIALSETFYTEYFQLYTNDGSFHTIKYYRTFDTIELHCPTPMAQARYDYLRFCFTCRLGTKGIEEMRKEEEEAEEEEEE